MNITLTPTLPAADTRDDFSCCIYVEPPAVIESDLSLASSMQQPNDRNAEQGQTPLTFPYAVTGAREQQILAVLKRNHEIRMEYRRCGSPCHVARRNGIGDATQWRGGQIWQALADAPEEPEPPCWWELYGAYVVLACGVLGLMMGGLWAQVMGWGVGR